MRRWWAALSFSVAQGWLAGGIASLRGGCAHPLHHGAASTSSKCACALAPAGAGRPRQTAPMRNLGPRL